MDETAIVFVGIIILAAFLIGIINAKKGKEWEVLNAEKAEIQRLKELLKNEELK